LRGHDNQISCITISRTGKYIASGQKTFMGYPADIIIWDFAEKALKFRLEMHKVVVSSLTFSHDENYLSSLGGEDSKASLVVWDTEKGKAMFGAPVG